MSGPSRAAESTPGAGVPPPGDRRAPDEARAAVRELFLDQPERHGCAETVYVVLKRAFALPDPDDASAAMALNGGIAYSGATCGAITGAALALGLEEGRRTPDHAAAKRAARVRTAELLRAFEAEFGATTCRALIGVDISTDEGHQAFIDEGAWRVSCLRQLEWVVDRLLEGDAAAARADVRAGT
jgi:C_GCAxxG_C_C family probable redox protein